jgi:hypothetical protein
METRQTGQTMLSNAALQGHQHTLTSRSRCSLNAARIFTFARHTHHVPLTLWDSDSANASVAPAIAASFSMLRVPSVLSLATPRILTIVQNHDDSIAGYRDPTIRWSWGRAGQHRRRRVQPCRARLSERLRRRRSTVLGISILDSRPSGCPMSSFSCASDILARSRQWTQCTVPLSLQRLLVRCRTMRSVARHRRRGSRHDMRGCRRHR